MMTAVICSKSLVQNPSSLTARVSIKSSYPATLTHCTYREIEVAFHLRLANSCNVLGTAEPATTT